MEPLITVLYTDYLTSSANNASGKIPNLNEIENNVKLVMDALTGTPESSEQDTQLSQETIDTLASLNFPFHIAGLACVRDVPRRAFHCFAKSNRVSDAAVLAVMWGQPDLANEITRTLLESESNSISSFSFEQIEHDGLNRFQLFFRNDLLNV